MFWPILFFSRLATALANNSKWAGIAVAFVLFITDVFDLLINVVMVQIGNGLLSLNYDNFMNVSLHSVELLGYANAVLPVSEFVTLMSSYVTAWVTVIGIRWLKSFVPTMAN